MVLTILCKCHTTFIKVFLEEVEVVIISSCEWCCAIMREMIEKP